MKMEPLSNEQLGIGLPTEILKEFESLKTLTNLNSSELMKSLLHAFRRENKTSQNLVDTSGEFVNYSAQQLQVPSKVNPRKSILGQKVNRVCEILQSKQAAKGNISPITDDTAYLIAPRQDVIMSENDVMMPGNEVTSPNEIISSYNSCITSHGHQSARDVSEEAEVLDLSTKKACVVEDDPLPSSSYYSQSDLGDYSIAQDLCVDFDEPVVDNSTQLSPSAVSVKIERSSPAITVKGVKEEIQSTPTASVKVEPCKEYNLHPSRDEIKSFIRNAVDRKRDIIKPVARKTSTKAKRNTLQKHEGLRLVNENTLFPGVYTGTFKLPGCRRGGRKHTIKSRITCLNKTNTAIMESHKHADSHQNIPNAKLETSSTYRAIPHNSNMQHTNLAQGSPQPCYSLMGLTQQDDSSVPSTMRDNIHVNMKQNIFTTLAAAQCTQTPIPHIITPANSSSLSTPCNTLTFMLSAPSNVTQYPNHIAQQPYFFTLPANQGMFGQVNLIPMQLIPQETSQARPPVESEVSTNDLTMPVGICSSMEPNCPKTDSAQSRPIEEKMPFGCSGNSGNGNEESEKNNHQQSPNNLSVSCETLSPVEKNQEQVRSRALKTDLVRSDSNFYCCSFKVNPRMSECGESARKNFGTPQTSPCHQSIPPQAQDYMFKELFCCKICKLVMPNEEKQSHLKSHQTKYLDSSSWPICSTCGVLFQKIVEQSPKESDNVPLLGKHCRTCTDMFEREISKAKILENELSPCTQVTCDKCMQKFSTQISLLQHRRLIHNENTDYYLCNSCEKIFFSLAMLKYHMKTHSRSKNKYFGYIPTRCDNKASKPQIFTCPYSTCKRTFPKNFQLKEHVRVKHLKIKPFTCCWSGCSKQFSGVRHLKVHMLIHNDEKPLRCSYCEYRCRQRNALNWHMRKHPEVPYKYRTSRRFRQKPDLVL